MNRRHIKSSMNAVFANLSLDDAKSLLPTASASDLLLICTLRIGIPDFDLPSR